ncbi:hypothetical protein BCV70DRAFT_204789 [Testicularia cyperi]|uniref:Uncharacterized protein n=1 Tax=Testicularia cyperi TaxID=1882483 RepID=A0A317XW68_9BASI|nr:hypothetical protein BCV70DRAFT_204789 [Testicularia cyperi]
MNASHRMVCELSCSWLLVPTLDGKLSAALQPDRSAWSLLHEAHKADGCRQPGEMAAVTWTTEFGRRPNVRLSLVSELLHLTVQARWTPWTSAPWHISASPLKSIASSRLALTGRAMVTPPIPPWSSLADCLETHTHHATRHPVALRLPHEMVYAHCTKIDTGGLLDTLSIGQPHPPASIAPAVRSGFSFSVRLVGAQVHSCSACILCLCFMIRHFDWPLQGDRTMRQCGKSLSLTLAAHAAPQSKFLAPRSSDTPLQNTTTPR